MLSITQWPAQERPRERLLSLGAESLSDAELLAIFLRTGVPGKTAVDLAREALNKFGSLRQLLRASKKEFCTIHGFGDTKYVQLQACLELGKRHLNERISFEDVIKDPSDTYRYLTKKLRVTSQASYTQLPTIIPR